MKDRSSTARIDALFAREANCAVLIRRGPSRWVRLYVWSFETDTIVAGDWIHGRVYSRRSDVSPDGKHVVFLVSGARDSIVVSALPSAEPLARWELAGPDGGGIWRDNRTVVTAPGPVYYEEKVRPRGFTVKRGPWLLDADIAMHRMRLIKDGWTNLVPDAEPEKTVRNTLAGWLKSALEGLELVPTKGPVSFILLKEFAGGTIVHTRSYDHEKVVVQCANGLEKLALESSKNHPVWIDLDRDGRLVFADKGCLFAWREFPARKPEMIADLNDYRTTDPPSVGP